ncbi:MAG: ATP-binding protein [Syntrophales bacterium]|nr:ATP-binding protein [Syntrophales bacterium]
MKKNDVIRLSLPSDLSYLSLAQMVIRETALKIGFTGDDLYQIDLAAEEAISNVMVHAFAGQERENFDLICERAPLGMKITIKEKGLPFDPGQIPDYHPAENIDQMSASGMGVFLMKEYMDEVYFRNLGMEGKETNLVKYLPAKSIESYLSAQELAEAEAGEVLYPGIPSPSLPMPKDIPYTVRRMEPAEAVEIARCAYKSHGYTFFDDHIYYPERIIELNGTDEMISAVAVTEDNIFMGHSALVYPTEEARIAEFTFVFVNQEFRGQGCMKRIADFLFQCPKKKPLDGIYVYSVTNHEFTQRGMAQFDIHDCGLLLASSPETWVFKGIEAQDQRISVALSFKYLTPPPKMILYPPARHRAIIERLYENIGARDHGFHIPDVNLQQSLPPEAEILTDVLMTENCAEIHVIGYGDNIVHEVRRTLRELCLKNVAAIQLFLDLKDPHTFFMAAEFEKIGFFFAGILPLALVGDALILQYLNNVRVDYDKIALYTEKARQIRDYVRQMDPQRDYQ